MIRVNQVSKVYTTARGEVRALDDFSLEIERGEYVAVCGPSGCGKSTLLTLIGGLALPTSGEVWVGENHVSSMTSSQRAEFRQRGVGFVFQMFHLLPFLTVMNNVVLAAPSRDRESALARAGELLERFGITDRQHHRPGQLSAGERQRVAMARAMLNEPKLMLADEPTGNLDPDNTKIVLNLLDEYHESGGTIVLVTHDGNAAKRARRSILLEKGKLLTTA